ncbi:hypothetical protein [Bradyrhizobium sp.]|jgi:hypothetical protein|uniref:hypothetical protein n=1 Tax=Bradyrhizobium sp. TaxID=376 RepID=UPI003C5738C2
MDVEAEMRDIKRRITQPKGPSGFLTRQVQGVHKDLLSFEEKTERKLREHDGRFNRLDGELDALDRKIDAKVDGLAKALPAIVVDAVRGANRDREGKH